MLEYIRKQDFLLLEEGFVARDLIDRMIEEFSDTEDRDAFYVADLGDVVKKHLRFLKTLPRVKPFYALKCNSSLGVLQTLAQLGAGFDCASKMEIDMIRSLGVPPERIIYANPCKQPSHIKHAARSGVRVMTFDSEEELVKVSASHPNARMLLRISTDDSLSTIPLSEKFGAPLKACRHLLEVAKRLSVEIIGVSFHVGSGGIETHTFTKAIAEARMLFDVAEELGHTMYLLDIGGGFPGTEDVEVSFEKIAAVINTALDTHFPEGCGVEVIAEPGRYYVASAFTLAVNIIAKKVVLLEPSGSQGEGNCKKKRVRYYLNDGTYGSFQHIYGEHPVLKPTPHKNPSLNEPLYVSSLWGPTCKALDKIVDCLELPEMQVGDWLIFDNLGAYSMAVSFTFNGFQPPQIYYAMPQCAWDLLTMGQEDLLQRSLSE